MLRNFLYMWKVWLLFCKKRALQRYCQSITVEGVRIDTELKKSFEISIIFSVEQNWVFMALQKWIMKMSFSVSIERINERGIFLLQISIQEKVSHEEEEAKWETVITWEQMYVEV